MYDMYPWDWLVRGLPPRRRTSQAPRPRRGIAGPADQAASRGPPRRATADRREPVQVALDRRDNGGDTRSPAGQAPARPARQ